MGGTVEIVLERGSRLSSRRRKDIQRALLQDAGAAVGKDNLGGEQVVGCHAVLDRVGAGGIGRQAAAQGGAVCGGGVRPKDQPVGGGSPVESADDHPRLDGRGASFGIDLQDAGQEAGAVQDQRSPNCLPGKRGACPARQDRHASRGAHGDCRGEVILGAWKSDAQRLDLVDGRVGAVEQARDRVCAHVSREVLLQQVYEILIQAG
jgi:hypothetical protein